MVCEWYGRFAECDEDLRRRHKNNDKRRWYGGDK